MGWFGLESFLLGSTTPYVLLSMVTAALLALSLVYFKMHPRLDRLQLVFAFTVLLYGRVWVASIAALINPVTLISCMAGLLGTLSCMALLLANAGVLASLAPRWRRKEGRIAQEFSFLAVAAATQASLFAAFAWTAIRCTL